MHSFQKSVRMKLFGKKYDIAVIGYGSWATALVGLLTGKGKSVIWHIRNLDILETVRSEGINPKYLSELELNTKFIEVSADINAVVDNADTVLVAVPAAYLKSFLEPLKISLSDKFIISATKGLIPGENMSVSEYLTSTYKLEKGSICVISGPSHAEEVSRGKMCFLTAAGEDKEKTLKAAELFSTRSLNFNYCDDVAGIEYSAVLKNVYGIAAGIALGLGYGDNFLAVLVSQCAGEIKQFLEKAFPAERNCLDRKYMADLMVTCYSPYSRNRRLGNLIGRGCTVRGALNELTMIAEGYFAASGIKQICDERNLQLPVADMVYKVLYQNMNARKAMLNLASQF